MVRSDLHRRHQCVHINGSRSDYSPILSGVPQGNILWPLIFLVYINDLLASVWAFHDVPSFTDNTKCFKTISNNYFNSQLFQEDLEPLAKWFKDWNLNYNTNKFFHLRFNLRFSTSYYVNSIPITILK